MSKKQKIAKFLVGTSIFTMLHSCNDASLDKDEEIRPQIDIANIRSIDEIIEEINATKKYLVTKTDESYEIAELESDPNPPYELFDELLWQVENTDGYIRIYYKYYNLALDALTMYNPGIKIAVSFHGESQELLEQMTKDYQNANVQLSLFVDYKDTKLKKAYQKLIAELGQKDGSVYLLNSNITEDVNDLLKGVDKSSHYSSFLIGVDQDYSAHLKDINASVLILNPSISVAKEGISISSKVESLILYDTLLCDTDKIPNNGSRSIKLDIPKESRISSIMMNMDGNYLVTTNAKYDTEMFLRLQNSDMFYAYVANGLFDHQYVEIDIPPLEMLMIVTGNKMIVTTPEGTYEYDADEKTGDWSLKEFGASRKRINDNL